VTFEPRIAFAVGRPETPGLEVRVNFGIWAGREATPAEIEELAQELLPELGELTILAERRYEFDRHSGAELHQVCVVVPPERLPWDEDEVERLRELIVGRAEHWARASAERRHADVSEP
jgi:hypothetical protein